MACERLPLDVDDEADAAGVVLGFRVVKALCGRGEVARIDHGRDILQIGLTIREIQ